MIFRIAISCLIFLFCLVFIVASYVIVPVLLLTSWDGRTTPFGNEKWGKGDTNPGYLRSGYWAAFVWLVMRNPVNNLSTQWLSLKRTSPLIIKGDTNIGDHVKGGFYKIRMGWAWEYYWVKPYNFLGKRCIRMRFGWKIADTLMGESVSYVCSFNPWKPYAGVN